MTARAEFRGRWRTWVALGVLIGTFGGFVVAAFAGARRTDTVVDRAIAAKVPPDVVMLPAFSLNGDLLRFEAIRAFPEVVEAHRLPLYFDRDGIEVLGSRDISVFGRSNLLAGRLPRADEPDEVTVNFLARERLGLDVGDTTTLHLAKAGSALEGGFVAGPSVPVRVVGVTASLGDFASVAEPGASVTPAFVRSYGEQAASIDLLAFRLRRGDHDLPAFSEHTRTLTGGKPVIYVELRNDRRQIQRSFQVQAFGLWMLGAFLALVAVLVLAQTLARQTFLESADHGILSSLGMGRRHLIGVHLIRSLFIGVVAGLGTMTVSYGLSGLPLESDTSTLGEGAFLTLHGIRTLEPSAPADTGFVRFEKGADRVEVIRRLRSLVGEDGVRLPSEPGVVVDFGRVRAMPLVLASIIALLSLATTAHVLISTGRRRRRDLAILKALGFVRGQVRRAVAWQASTLAVVSLVLGLPLGIALGRWTWTLLASFGGFVPEVDVPLPTVAGVAIGTLLATNMLAALPARAAARTQPALVLRSE